MVQFISFNSSQNLIQTFEFVSQLIFKKNPFIQFNGLLTFICIHCYSLTCFPSLFVLYKLEWVYYIVFYPFIHTIWMSGWIDALLIWWKEKNNLVSFTPRIESCNPTSNRQQTSNFYNLKLMQMLQCRLTLLLAVIYLTIYLATPLIHFTVSLNFME